MAFGIPNAQQLVAELTKPENLDKLKAAAATLVQDFAAHNVIHLDLDLAGDQPKVDISFTPKGTP